MTLGSQHPLIVYDRAMFIGHYGPAFASKPAHRPIPLWVLFVAVQWLDFAWSVLVLAGVEKLRVVPSLTEASQLDLYYMPYSHGLIGAVLLSLARGVIVAVAMHEARGRVLLIVAAAAFSHWLADLLVHTPDLPLYGDTLKVGFGLWRHIAISLPLEVASLIGGAWLYARFVPSQRERGDLWLALFVAGMVGLELFSSFAAPPSSPRAPAAMALAAYTLLTIAAGLVDRARGTR